MNQKGGRCPDLPLNSELTTSRLICSFSVSLIYAILIHFLRRPDLLDLYAPPPSPCPSSTSMFSISHRHSHSHLRNVSKDMASMHNAAREKEREKAPWERLTIPDFSKLLATPHVDEKSGPSHFLHPHPPVQPQPFWQCHSQEQSQSSGASVQPELPERVWLAGDRWDVGKLRHTRTASSASDRTLIFTPSMRSSSNTDLDVPVILDRESGSEIDEYGSSGFSAVTYLAATDGKPCNRTRTERPIQPSISPIQSDFSLPDLTSQSLKITLTRSFSYSSTLSPIPPTFSPPSAAPPSTPAPAPHAPLMLPTPTPGFATRRLSPHTLSLQMTVGTRSPSVSSGSFSESGSTLHPTEDQPNSAHEIASFRGMLGYTPSADVEEHYRQSDDTLRDGTARRSGLAIGFGSTRPCTPPMDEYGRVQSLASFMNRRTWMFLLWFPTTVSCFTEVESNRLDLSITRRHRL